MATAPPFQPETPPSAVAKMNRAGLPLGSLKSVVGLNTWPVGWLDGNGPAGGIVTGEIATGVPSPFSTSVLPVPSAETQAGPDVGNEMPHALTRPALI